MRNINIRSIGFYSGFTLLEFTKEKAGKLTRICRDLIRTDVVLKLENSATEENKRCEIRMVIPGNDLVAGYTANSFENAVLKTVEILARRIETRKNKRTDYRLYIL